MIGNDAIHRAEARAAEEAAAVAKQLGPGLITGAADDDPSGIATYSQAGAQFGFAMLWTMLTALPLMIAIQLICARIGAVTGRGLAGNIKLIMPRWVLSGLVLLLVVANVINIAADVAAMGEAAALVMPGVDFRLYMVGFGLLSLLLQVFLPYDRYVPILKWLTLALMAYVAVVFTVKIPWGQVVFHTFVPALAITKDSLTLLVGLLGTTISPYLFFWQSSEEVEELEKSHEQPLHDMKAGAAARKALNRIGIDTVVGMAFSQLVAYFIILTTAVTLNVHHVTNIDTAAQAAQALKPIAGPFASFIFALGIVGTGLLAVPVLAGSAAYAVAETRGWTFGLSRKLNEAKEFYAIIAAAVVGGILLSFSPIDPIKALVLSAVVNGVVAVPIMAAAMWVATRKALMGVFVATRLQRIFGWLATLAMGAAAVAMLVLMAV